MPTSYTVWVADAHAVKPRIGGGFSPSSTLFTARTDFAVAFSL